MTYHIIKPWNRESESNNTLSFHILSLLGTSIPTGSKKISVNRKQAVLCFGFLHAGSSMVDNHFYDSAFYYHWHPLFVHSEPWGWKCWQRGSECVCVCVCYFPTPVVNLCLCVFSSFQSAPQSKSTVPAAFMSHKAPILPYSRPPLCVVHRLVLLSSRTSSFKYAFVPSTTWMRLE